MGYRVIVDPKQSTLNFASKKQKLDEETDLHTSEKSFNDLAEVDPKQSTSNFASKKPKLDEETDPQTSEKGFNDLSE